MTWVKPELVVQVRYTEITDDGRLRHPTYLGLRDDKVASEIKADYRPKIETVPKATKSRNAPAKRSGKGSRAPNPLKAWAPHAEALTAQLDDLENQRVESALHEISGSAHSGAIVSVTDTMAQAVVGRNTERPTKTKKGRERLAPPAFPDLLGLGRSLTALHIRR